MMQIPRTIGRFIMALWLTGIASNALAQTAPLAGVRQIIAHRGSSADRPENTLASIRRAMEAGATAVEVDVRTTQDGKLVILHDATLDRTTNGTGPVEEKTLAEVRKLDAGSWFDPKYREERVPTLREVLAQAGNKIDVLLDLKGQGEEYVRKVVAEVKKHGSPKRTLIGVRSVEQARLFRKLLPEARQLGLIPNPKAIEAFAKEKVETIRLWPKRIQADAKLVERVRKSGAKLHLNGTTGKPDDILPLLKHEPDSLSSDDPACLVQTLTKVQSDRKTASLTPSEKALRKLLGQNTPSPIPLWPGTPPKFAQDAPAETVDEHARIRMVSMPTLSVYLLPKEKNTGRAIIVCPGGGYGGLDWRTHVVYAADSFLPKGVAVIGLKYRTRPPHQVDNAGIQEIALLDAKRAVRLVRQRAKEWNIAPHQIGIVGYSAGPIWR